jgi:hypothetical protein
MPNAPTHFEGLELDAAGNIILKPVIGWTTGVAEIAVILAVRYADDLASLETGGKQVQLLLTPPQALELSEKLTTLANKILNAPNSGAPN